MALRIKGDTSALILGTASADSSVEFIDPNCSLQI